MNLTNQIWIAGLLVFLGVQAMSLATQASEHSRVGVSKTSSSSATQSSSKKEKALRSKETDELPNPKGLDMDELRVHLRSDGLTGEIHAADPTNRQFVFTYRDPADFFNNVQIGMVSHKIEVVEFFSRMKRHDIVKIKGDFFHVGEFLPESPQPHIEVTEISTVKQYEPSVVAEEKFHKQTVLPNELRVKNRANFLVHAILKNGSFMVLEYKDNFVFVSVPDTTFTKDLYRNDRIVMRYKIQTFPEKPTHLELDTDTSDNKKPIEVLDSVHNLHGKILTQEGHLVRFPKSPQINRDIWAIEQRDNEENNSRTFTLVNFSKPGEQKRIDEKLKDWWDRTDKNAILDGRNKLINREIKIRAKGIMNVVAPNQANAQMKLKAKDIVLLKN